jgi:hypothetical protein
VSEQRRTKDQVARDKRVMEVLELGKQFGLQKHWTFAF